MYKMLSKAICLLAVAVQGVPSEDEFTSLP